jgi:hypothetical protein
MAYDSGFLGGPIHFGSKGNANFWVLDTVDAVVTAIASGYISDGYLRGMQLGDFVLIRKYDSLVTKANPTISLHTVTAVTSAENTTLSAAVGDSSGLTVPVTSSTGTPGVTSDLDLGYMLGSIWVETDQDQAYVALDVTDGAAVWRPIVDQFVMTETGISIDTDGTTGRIRMAIPQPANLIKAFTVNNAVTTSAGSAIITISRNSTAVTNGVITIDGTTGTGVVDSATPTALNTFAAADVLNGVISGTQTAAATVNFCALFERLPA